MTSKKISERFMMRRKPDVGSMTESDRIAARRYHCREADKYKDQHCVSRGRRGGSVSAENRENIRSDRNRLMKEVEVVPSLKGKILHLENENFIMAEKIASLLEYLHEMRLERSHNYENSTGSDLGADSCVCCGTCKTCHYENFSDTDDTDDGKDVIDGGPKV